MRRDSKIFPYVVIIKQKGRRKIEILGIISSLIFILILLQRIYEYPSARIINMLVFVSVSGMLVYNILQFRSGKKISLRPLHIVAFLALLLIPPINWFLLFFIIMALLEKMALTPEEIGFSDEEIVFSGMMKKTIRWNELNNVILKDGIISIDFNNNKLIQKETDDGDDENEDASEQEFNSYCAERLKIANCGLRITD
jgi:hypothetical protein